jgi:hypothetical protein
VLSHCNYHPFVTSDFATALAHECCQPCLAIRHVMAWQLHGSIEERLVRKGAFNMRLYEESSEPTLVITVR